ncbi:MAG: hypothetical protein F4Z04_05005 [Acidobacteria bacterium]|nr:hypothetical protein [Acidobacteriota bacterium]
MTATEELTIQECLDRVRRYGDKRTKTAIEKYANDVSERVGDGRIRFEWCDADAAVKQACSIRGAFTRIAKKGREEGRCSSKASKATYRIVRGARLTDREIGCDSGGNGKHGNSREKARCGRALKTVDDLRELCNTPEGPYLRPFAPNPKWAEARIFIVGTNPATPLRREFDSFDEYWDSLTRNPESFYRHYSEKHDSGQSRTTARRRRFEEKLKPINVLVTNAMIYPAPRKKRIPNKAEQRRIGIRCFQLLFGVCRPSSVLFHGADATRLAEEAFGGTLNPYLPIDRQDTVVGDPAPCHLFAFPHFSGVGVQPGYKVSEMDEELARLAERMKTIERNV